MQKLGLCLFAFSTFLVSVLGAFSQPGGDKEKGPKKGPPPFELGKVLPPFVRELLDLTEDQKQQIADLEKEVRAKLQKILTAEQQQRIGELRDKGKKGPPDGEKKRPPLEVKGDEPPPDPQALAAGNLVKNAVFAEGTPAGKTPRHFTMNGAAQWAHVGTRFEFGLQGIAFDCTKELDGARAGEVYQDVAVAGGRGKWFRFSVRGLAENNFAVDNDDLYLRVEFFSDRGKKYLEQVTRKIYPLVEKDRRELAENGKYRKGGGAAWRTFTFEFMLPFNEIDQLRLVAGFRKGVASAEKNAVFYATDFRLTPVAAPADRPQIAANNKKKNTPADLVPLGGRWYWRADPGVKEKPAKLTVDWRNVDRLYYKDHQWSNPFAENMSAWMLKGYLDYAGNLVAEDRFVPRNIVLRFDDDKTMIVQTRNLPNHATSIFPAPAGSGDRNPNYIQEQSATYYIPLNPTPNPKAVAMDKTNSNRALPMGAIAIAVNGVVFYNPFDIGIKDATDMMDRCCGHPSQDNRYHYHKYPICVKSPFADEGEDHSPLIGFAFDGMPIYGPYESKGVLARDLKDNPLNDFNAHHDDIRRWHYHVTPGRFPYVLGGYWCEADSRNFRKGKK